MKRSVYLLTILAILSIGIFCAGCNNADQTTTQFPVSRHQLQLAIDTLYARHPEYKIPLKWAIYNDWGKRGFEPKDGNMFYFKSNPEEMYYVIFRTNKAALADTANTYIKLLSVNNGNSFEWLQSGGRTSGENERIQQRFNTEIVSKLEQYANCKVVK